KASWASFIVWLMIFIEWHIMNKWAVLESGVITLKVVGIVLFKKPDINAVSVVSRPHIVKLDEYYMARQLNEYYQEYLFDSRIIREFEFRDKFMKEAVRLFNGPGFATWVISQVDSPFISNLGMKFLKD